MSKSHSKILALITATVALTGCASIMNSGAKENLVVKSTPPQASVTITDEKRIIVFQGITPATVALEKKDSNRGKKYIVEVVKQGFLTKEVMVDTKISGWFYGNALVGGIIGIVVDSSTGNYWTLETNELDIKLDPVEKQSKLNDNALLLHNSPFSRRE